MEDFYVPALQSTMERVRVEPYQEGQRLVAAIDCRAGQVLFRLPLKHLVSVPTRTSIQVALHQHVECGDTISFMNHSFQPTVLVTRDEHDLLVRALVHLSPGTPVSFDYNTTEYELSCPFQDYDSGRWVKGYKYLSMDDRVEISGMTMPYLRIVE